MGQHCDIFKKVFRLPFFFKIMRARRAKEAWEILKQEYHGDSKVQAIKLLNLRREFENMKMKENDTLDDYSQTIFQS